MQNAYEKLKATKCQSVYETYKVKTWKKLNLINIKPRKFCFMLNAEFHAKALLKFKNVLWVIPLIVAKEENNSHIYANLEIWAFTPPTMYFRRSPSAHFKRLFEHVFMSALSTSDECIFLCARNFLKYRKICFYILTFVLLFVKFSGKFFSTSTYKLYVLEARLLA